MSERWAKWMGMAFQALILGALVFLAVARLLALHAGVRVFEYQMF